MSVAHERITFSDSAEYAVGSPAPPPNDGDTGSLWHWQTVGQAADALRRAGYRDIRVDQQQVRDGVIVGVNRPDVQAIDPRGRRVIVEVDTDMDESRRHQRVVTGLDPGARSIFITRDPATRKVCTRVHHRRRPAATRRISTPTYLRRRALSLRSRLPRLGQRETEYLLRLTP